ncbi:arsenate reductase (glutaredoxin) [Aliidiomarina halalkaliphila]|uniref:Arsenate reductase n=1 Tax=Aliidiomarina halalkaliphila TaxID=2593535 RepID=A0A552X4S9_9GAMM|nr:arsenate reductase (glutaredoxin) [Aliidiomarina halalkaliphila]TRW49966.1 arsenate reductase (glutaredoxin) [Aliidiomarina halalkaliphila]
MSEYTIYHNPRCSKSRETLKLLQEKGIEPRVVEYLKNPLLPTELLDLADQVGVALKDLLRNKEDEYKAHGFADVLDSPEQLAKKLSEHIKVLERPIVVNNDSKQGRVGRPPENVLEIL